MIDLRQMYNGRRVLITGHTGFKGQYLMRRLEELGATPFGYSLPSHDVRDRFTLAEVVQGVRPHFIFHLAAQAFVPRGYREPLLTFDTNTSGTVNLLGALREYTDRCAVVVVTTDKVYGEGVHNEDSPLRGRCPYSASKVAAEQAVDAFRSAFFAPDHRIGVATARAGNVIGGGDWGDGRLVPNAIRALRSGQPIPVFHPDAVRPWQYIDDVVEGYVTLAALIANDGRSNNPFCTSFNFGPAEHHTVQEVVEQMIRAWGSGTWERVPMAMREVDELRIVSTKARRLLDWKPKWSFDAMIQATVRWYKENA